MKKTILGLMLVLSVGAFASDHHDGYDNQEEMLEKRFEMRGLTDGKIKLEEIEYDVDIDKNEISIELEIEPTAEDANWVNFDKKIFNEKMQELAEETRKSIGATDIPVNISVELERRFRKDETVYSKTF